MHIQTKLFQVSLHWYCCCVVVVVVVVCGGYCDDGVVAYDFADNDVMVSVIAIFFADVLILLM